MEIEVVVCLTGFCECCGGWWERPADLQMMLSGVCVCGVDTEPLKTKEFKLRKNRKQTTEVINTRTHWNVLKGWSEY